MANDVEEPLEGGNATQGVVRVGDTVRKPWSPSTSAAVEFMAAVASAGVDVPATLGRDRAGRQVLEFVPGSPAMGRTLSPGDLGRVGALVRAIHDGSEGFQPSEPTMWHPLLPAPAGSGPTLFCHNDLAPWNLIVGERWVFIDWDGAGPSTRLWDLAYAVQTFALNDADAVPAEAASRLAAFVDGYGADSGLRRRLPATMARRTSAMYEMLRSSHRGGREPWGSMYVDGHGDHWKNITRFVERHQGVWARALGAAANVGGSL
jgi:hypothetical protein